MLLLSGWMGSRPGGGSSLAPEMGIPEMGTFGNYTPKAQHPGPESTGPALLDTLSTSPASLVLTPSISHAAHSAQLHAFPPHPKPLREWMWFSLGGTSQVQWPWAHGNLVKWSEVKVVQSCPTLCDPMDYTVCGILQTRILEWVAYPFSSGSSWPRNQTGVSWIAVEFFTN